MRFAKQHIDYQRSSMMTRRAVSRWGIGLLVMLCCVAAGCREDNPLTSQELDMLGQAQDSRPTAPQSLDVGTARRLLRADLEEVIGLVKPAKFTRVDPTGLPEVLLTCPRPDGSDGKSYSFKTLQSPMRIDSPEATAKLISDHWRGKGYNLQLRTKVGYEILAWTREGGSMTFIVSGVGMTLSGESACVPS